MLVPSIYLSVANTPHHFARNAQGTTRKLERRAVVLLVVLVILTMFAVIGLAFMFYADSDSTMASAYRDSTPVPSGDVDPELAFQLFLQQLLYDCYDDPQGWYSSMRGQSLMRSMYGGNYSAAIPPTSVPVPIAAGTQVVAPLSMQGIGVGTKLLVGKWGILPKVGVVEAPETVVVTAVTATTFTATFLYPHPAPGTPPAPAPVMVLGGIRFDTPLATGTQPNNFVPYNGTGRLAYPYSAANIQPGTPGDGVLAGTNSDVTMAGTPVPITPPDDRNLVSYAYFPTISATIPPFSQAIPDFIRDPERLGARATTTSPNATPAYPYYGLNAPYTYADRNNMFLAAIRNDGTLLMPSFHRNYNGISLNSSDLTYALWTTTPDSMPWLKYTTLRPRPIDQMIPITVPFPPQNPICNKVIGYKTPNSRPCFPLPEDAGGDVRNRPLGWGPPGNDSIWMYLGAPVWTLPDGRQYTMLHAPMIMCLDSKPNVNVHGNAAAGSNQGWSPTEVNPALVMGANDFQQLIFGLNNQAGAKRVLGKYGVDATPPAGTAGFNPPVLSGTRIAGASIAASGATIPSGSPMPPNTVIEVTPASMAGITLGVMLGVDTPVTNPNFEVVIVTSVTATTFQATFTKQHVVGTAAAGGATLASITIQPNSHATVDFDGKNNGKNPGPWTLPALAYQIWPTYPPGTFANASAAERLRHPLLYNPITTTTGVTTNHRVFTPAQLEMLYRYGDRGSDAMQSDLAQLLSASLLSPTASHSVTTISWDRTSPGLVAWLPSTAPATAPYKIQGTFIPPTPGVNGAPGNAGSGPVFPSGAAVAFPGAGKIAGIGGEFSFDGRALQTILKKVNLNRTLPAYPPVNTTAPSLTTTASQTFNLKPLPPGPNTPPFDFMSAADKKAYQNATLARQRFATDILNVLRAVTGVYNPDNYPNVMPSPDGKDMQALRYLAQLAVNIVDFIDDDDIITPFPWTGTSMIANGGGAAIPTHNGVGIGSDAFQLAYQNDFVFGTELPKLVINEAYTQFSNRGNENPPPPLRSTPPIAPPIPAATSFNVDTWVELCNPFNKNPVDPVTQKPLPFGQGGFMDGAGDARLFATPIPGSNTGYPVYQLLLTQRNLLMHAPENTSGMPDWAPGGYRPGMSPPIPGNTPTLPAPVNGQPQPQVYGIVANEFQTAPNSTIDTSVVRALDGNFAAANNQGGAYPPQNPNTQPLNAPRGFYVIGPKMGPGAAANAIVPFPTNGAIPAAQKPPSATINSQALRYVFTVDQTKITIVRLNVPTGSQIVTPVSMNGIGVGTVLTIDTGSNAETVTVTAVTATTFTATFVKQHTGPFPVFTANNVLPTATPPTIVLQRLLCPYAPPDSRLTIPDTNDPTRIIPNPQYNPYITVDYFSMTSVAMNNAALYAPTAIPGLTLPAINTRGSLGRAQPYARARNFQIVDFPGSTNPRLDQAILPPNQPMHTFFHTNTSPTHNKTDPTKPNTCYMGDPNQVVFWNDLFTNPPASPNPKAGQSPTLGADLVPYSWPTHLDRPLVSPMELLNVSAYRGHEFTYAFNGSAYGQQAHWFDNGMRLYRFFEFAETASRQAGTFAQTPAVVTTTVAVTIQPGLQDVTPASMVGIGQGTKLKVIDAGGNTFEFVTVKSVTATSFKAMFVNRHPASPVGPVTIVGTLLNGQSPQTLTRVPGKININNIWDANVLAAICDAQAASHVNAGNVTSIYSQLLALRSPGGAPGANDRPFLPLTTGFGTATTQYPNGTGIDDTLLRPLAAGGAYNTPRLFDIAGTGSFQQHELLAKIFNNLTTRSNCFAVWCTVGFFEVNKVDSQTGRVYLGQELNRATNQHIRHRMFAVIDRSAFQWTWSYGSGTVAAAMDPFAGNPAAISAGLGNVVTTLPADPLVVQNQFPKLQVSGSPPMLTSMNGTALVSTTVPRPIPAGKQVVQPVSMVGIVQGMTLTIGGPGALPGISPPAGIAIQETVTVTAVTPTSFTATFAFDHAGTGATPVTITGAQTNATMAILQPGMVLQISGTGTTEEVVVQSVGLQQFPLGGPPTANTRFFQTFTANFASAHPAGFTIRVLGNPGPLIRFNPHASAYAPVVTHFSIIE
jgi:hypothetical protein